jgi:PLP dependent protein
MTTSTGIDVASRLTAVRERVAVACGRADRSPASVRIIGVTKTHAPELGLAAVEAGLIDLGENRVQELVAKQPLVPGARWHLVGQLQRNKVRDVVGRQILVHSVGRRRLADALSRRAAELGSLQRVLIQVNVGDDPAKGGCRVDEARDLVAYARELPNLAVEGLMTIPPLPAEHEDPANASREHFARLRGLRDEVRESYPEVVHLSMGMSADLEAAVEEGATMIRVGTAVFGPRGQSPWRPQEDNNR